MFVFARCRQIGNGEITGSGECNRLTLVSGWDKFSETLLNSCGELRLPI